jgi:hypothetical protein
MLVPFLAWLGYHSSHTIVASHSQQLSIKKLRINGKAESRAPAAWLPCASGRPAVPGGAAVSGGCGGKMRLSQALLDDTNTE